MSLRDEVLEGSLWTALGRYSSKGITFLVTAVLSRMLPPEDFGVVGMVVAVTSFAGLLAEAGIGSAVIQKEGLDDEDLSTVFWLSLLVGGGLAALLLGGAPLIGDLYRDQRVVDVTRVISAKFFLLGIITVPMALLKKSFRFREIAGVKASAAGTAGVLAVVLAMQGAGYWALVAQILVTSLLQVVGLGLVMDWRPGAVFRTTAVRKVVGYSGFVLGSNSVNYWSRRADDLLVGRVLGASQLGFYEHAYTLMMVPLQLLTYVTQPVLHPVLVSVKEDVERMRRAYLELTEFLGLVSFPVAALLAVLAGPLVLVIWGPQWDPTVDVFRVLALLAALQPVVSTAGSIFMVRDRTRLMLLVSTVNMVALIAAFVIGLSGGIVGVAVGFGVAYLLVVAPLTLYVIVVTLLEGSVTSILRIFVRPVAAGVVVGLASLLTYELVAPYLGKVLVLLVVSVAATGAHLLYLRYRAWDRVEVLAETRLGTYLQKRWGVFGRRGGENGMSGGGDS